ncbi:MAG: S1 RNA-binding domain-containing protein [Myxococcales bacterium]|nr:S1 RNA-binding domain-containing protein [Myxococcales bacterium]MCB9643356.1 S1 RNA-binding domain-containing protein [Myxococcales bacterium]
MDTPVNTPQDSKAEKQQQASDIQAKQAIPTTDIFQESEDDAALMEAYLNQVERPMDFSVGQEVEGEVIKVGGENLFVALGGKSEASMSKDAFVHAGLSIPEVGDRVRAYVTVSRGDQLELGLQMQAGEDVMGAIEDALHSRIPVEARVISRNKGGLEVEIFGKRAFCPVSHIELRFCENPDQYVGQTLTVRVLEVKEGGRKIVVSRKDLLEEEAAKKIEALRDQLVEGAELEGTVTSLMDYGAFVDVGGIEGLVHVSEISHARVDKPAEILQKGQKVKVKILSYQADRDRISLSMKALENDPWETATQELQEGDVRSATVMRLEPFGAFMEIAPGVEGLVHISEISYRHIGHPREALEIGDRHEVKVIRFEPMRKRIGLSLRALEEAPRAEPTPDRPERPSNEGLREGDIMEVTVDKIEPFGVFVVLPEGQRGLVPNVEMGTPRGADHNKMFPAGTKFQAALVQIDSKNNRLRLSRKAVDEAEERAQTREYKKKVAEEEKKGFGTLADLLKGIR